MHAPASARVVIVGAGIGGLTAAALLAARGFQVTVAERAAAPGGKMRETNVGGLAVDSGPTVLTMRWVFDAIFAAAGARLDDHVALAPAGILARHGWPDGSRLDLFADFERSVDAIAAFAGPAEAAGFRAFSAEAARIYDTLEAPFLEASRTNPIGLSWRMGVRGFPALTRIRPYTGLWRALGDHFHDPRLRQLFGRYSTYAGSSPFAAPATLMLIAHVERRGVWMIEGGMHRLARALEALAGRNGVTFRYGTDVSEILVARGRADGVRLADGETIEAEHVLCNADPAALAAGRFGAAASGAVARVKPRARSLSALCWQVSGRASGFPLVRHNVFFSSNYPKEFAALRAGRLADEPTIYVCAQDRDDAGAAPDPERFLLIVNAPADGDVRRFTQAEIDACTTRTFATLASQGLILEPRDMAVTTPADFEALFPSTGGALYGRASHGWAASFLRPGSRTRIPGLYCAGGSCHPGAGVPMAALSGRLAAEAMIADRASTRRFHPAATAGGMSTR